MLHHIYKNPLWEEGERKSLGDTWTCADQQQQINLFKFKKGSGHHMHSDTQLA